MEIPNDEDMENARWDRVIRITNDEYSAKLTVLKDLVGNGFVDIMSVMFAKRGKLFSYDLDSPHFCATHFYVYISIGLNERVTDRAEEEPELEQHAVTVRCHQECVTIEARLAFAYFVRHRNSERIQSLLLQCPHIELESMLATIHFIPDLDAYGRVMFELIGDLISTNLATDENLETLFGKAGYAADAVHQYGLIMQS